jgi:hypothetical protein
VVAGGFIVAGGGFIVAGGTIPAGGVVGIGLIPIGAGGESTGFTTGVVPEPGFVGLMMGTPPVTASSWMAVSEYEMSILFSSPTTSYFWTGSKIGISATLG